MRRTPPPERDLYTVTIVVGTRPEFIKIAPVVRSIQSSDVLRLRLIHTGQHYDQELNESFFETLELPPPDLPLGVGSGTHGKQTGEAMIAIERDLINVEPEIVLAQGDTNAVLSAALSTSKLEILFGHVEAGIRSFDRTMPEEINRVIADHVSDLLFAPTNVAADNLSAEGITEGVHITGNTIVDACQTHKEIAVRNSTVLDRLNVEPDSYITATIHRPRNTDDRDRLRTIATTLDAMSVPVYLPTHPRTKAALDIIDFEPSGSLQLLEPLDYLDFLRILTGARAVVTDSGGIQEEASILNVPCLTVRPNTERPETVEAGVNRLVEPDELADQLRKVVELGEKQMVGASQLYGDGTAGQQIVETIETRLIEEPIPHHQ